tara:strand:- start:111 stop:332 length:222 start_codon:yes stop_codon:yes gene_type:complete
MEQHETTEQKQARTYESFSEETKESIRFYLRNGYRFIGTRIEYRNNWEGTWNFFAYLGPEQIAYIEFLNREVE